LKEYQPAAQNSFSEIARSLTDILSGETSASNSTTAVSVAIFIGRVALDLSFESSFADDLLMNDGQSYERERLRVTRSRITTN
jgi:hypothetical protein